MNGEREAMLFFAIENSNVKLFQYFELFKDFCSCIMQEGEFYPKWKKSVDVRHVKYFQIPISIRYTTIFPLFEPRSDYTFSLEDSLELILWDETHQRKWDIKAFVLKVM